ncbi:uncharacterized protein [Miscanthus floridulus]|uniref:uncharacterized protein n=1 Tax=Miscanthus floridulus TaxID=154761 RepID=UPI003457A0BA
MYPDAFRQLHDILVQNNGLQSTGDFPSVESLTLFLWGVGTRQCQRQMADRFRRGLGTVSDKFGEVLESVASFADAVLRPRDAHYRTVHERLEKYTPFFDGCIGALDGTHIRAGAVHDMKVLRDAWAVRGFPHPPQGSYYLVDSGYAGEAGYLGPYRNSRYHMREFERRRAENWEEIYNFHHSSLRNVIERSFGVLKARWQMMQGVPHYPRETIQDYFGLLWTAQLHGGVETSNSRYANEPMDTCLACRKFD